MSTAPSGTSKLSTFHAPRAIISDAPGHKPCSQVNDKDLFLSSDAERARVGVLFGCGRAATLPMAQRYFLF